MKSCKCGWWPEHLCKEPCPVATEKNIKLRIAEQVYEQLRIHGLPLEQRPLEK